MKKTVLAVIAMAIIPASVFAVDGQVVINQATVTAPGGFPYKILSPGSYKLSGDLTMSTTTNGNYAGLDIAIAIGSSNVTLDLNGFSIIVTNTNASITHQFFAIAEIGTFSQITVQNGSVTVISPGVPLFANGLGWGIFLNTSAAVHIHDTSVVASFNNANSVTAGAKSLVRHNQFIPQAFFSRCPSLIVENVGVSGVGDGCLEINNTQ